MQHIVHIDALPDNALDAASEFSAKWLPAIREQIGAGDSYVLVMPHAAYDHADWRRAAIRDLARTYAPARLNMVSGGDNASIMSAQKYLEGAGGVTGQYLPLSRQDRA